MVGAGTAGGDTAEVQMIAAAAGMVGAAAPGFPVMLIEPAMACRNSNKTGLDLSCLLHNRDKTCVNPP